MYWHMPNEPLAGVADRLAAFPRKVAWCWAAYRDQLGDAPFQVINLTVRGDVEVPSLQLTYDHMLLRSTMLPAEEAAYRIQHQVMNSADPLYPIEFANDWGQAYWLPSKMPLGWICPALPHPVYVFKTDVPAGKQMQYGSALSLPLVAPRQRFFPSGLEALCEVLLGYVPELAYRSEAVGTFILRLPDKQMRLNEFGFNGSELIAEVEPTEASTPVRPHVLHVGWRQSDGSWADTQEDIDGAGTFRYDVGDRLEQASAIIVEADGTPVDYREIELPPEPISYSDYPPTALVEALDFLDSSWRNVFAGERLLKQGDMTTHAGLALGCASRDDFLARMTDLAAVLNSLQVPPLPSAPRTYGGTPPGPLVRLEAYLREQLSDDGESAALGDAVETLRSIVALRNAMQHHADRAGDVLARFEVGYPVDWPLAWTRVRSACVDQVHAIRRIVQRVEYRASEL